MGYVHELRGERDCRLWWCGIARANGWNAISGGRARGCWRYGGDRRMRRGGRSRVEGF